MWDAFAEQAPRSAPAKSETRRAQPAPEVVEDNDISLLKRAPSMKKQMKTKASSMAAPCVAVLGNVLADSQVTNICKTSMSKFPVEPLSQLRLFVRRNLIARALPMSQCVPGQ